MTIIEHLEELRSRIIRMLIAFCVAAVVAWFLYNPILSFLVMPLRHLPQAAKIIKGSGALIVTSPTEPLFIRAPRKPKPPVYFIFSEPIPNTLTLLLYEANRG